MDSENSHSTIHIEVAYATPEKQVLLSLSVPVGTTVAEGIEQSAIQYELQELKIDPKAVGIFSRKVPLDFFLKEPKLAEAKVEVKTIVRRALSLTTGLSYLLHYSKHRRVRRQNPSRLC